MGLMDDIKQKACTAQKRVVLPEGTEERTIKAAEIIAKEGIAKVILIGNEDEIRQKAKGLDYTGVTIIDSTQSDKLDDYAQHSTNFENTKELPRRTPKKLYRIRCSTGV